MIPLFMAKLSASEIAAQLREMGQRLAMESGNHYRAKAYIRAAENLALSTTPIGQLIDGDGLTEYQEARRAGCSPSLVIMPPAHLTHLTHR